MYIYIYIYIYTCVYIYIYTHTHVSVLILISEDGKKTYCEKELDVKAPGSGVARVGFRVVGLLLRA